MVDLYFIYHILLKAGTWLGTVFMSSAYAPARSNVKELGVYKINSFFRG